MQYIRVKTSQPMCYAWVGEGNLKPGEGDYSIVQVLDGDPTEENHAHHLGSIALGLQNEAYQRFSTVIGGGNRAGMTEEEFNARYWDPVNNKGLNGGYKDADGVIRNDYGSRWWGATTWAFAGGNGSQALGRESLAFGYKTYAYGNNSTALGENTKSIGKSAVAIGHSTEAIGEMSLAGGLNSKAKGYCSFAGGIAETNEDASFAIAYGWGLSAVEPQAVFGTFNSPKQHAKLVVGNGTNEGDLRNAFVVLDDGRAKIQTDPSEDDDVVNLRTLNDKIASGNTTGVEIDESLTIVGQAADAKATGDALAGKVDKLPSDGTNRIIYAQDSGGNQIKLYPMVHNNNTNEWWVPVYHSSWGQTEPTGIGRLVSKDPIHPYQLANKNYVDNGLEEKVGFTNYASTTNAGVIRVRDAYGSKLLPSDNQYYPGCLIIQPATNANIDARSSYAMSTGSPPNENSCRPITSGNLDYAVKKALTTKATPYQGFEVSYTEEEQKAAQETLGIKKLYKHTAYMLSKNGESITAYAYSTSNVPVKFTDTQAMSTLFSYVIAFNEVKREFILIMDVGKTNDGGVELFVFKTGTSGPPSNIELTIYDEMETVVAEI